ncbi:GNAT family N-acetyltransferase [Maritalea sp.]|jgi:ribosomal protein S18 acetylase RimI-like enzyme|uniref:GNAT family N-acetyltransferase n=1 Tax=Maritalea sp. TaxID=2003361 RepID=UPI0039E353E6
MINPDISIAHQNPAVDEYCAMRIAAGLSAKSKEAASIGLPNSLFAVCIRNGAGELIAMGRLIGDGGCFVQVCDIAVRPDHQGHGLGRKVMQELMDHIDRTIPAGAFISLFADGSANELYKKFSFGETAPVSLGMAKYVK